MSPLGSATTVRDNNIHTHNQNTTVTYENLFGRTETGEENGRQRARGGAGGTGRDGAGRGEVEWSGGIPRGGGGGRGTGRDGAGVGCVGQHEKKKTKKKKVK
jgi:hypothetical protein